MELRQLAVFCAVAELGSFTQAARSLGMAQSAVSRAVRGLEDEFGVLLFDRTTHRVDLTPAGRLSLAQAQRTLEAAASITDLIQRVRDGLSGTLRVGVMQRDPGFPLPRLLADFAAEHPGLEVRLRRGNSATHAVNLRQGLLDLAFVAVSARQGLDITPLRRTPMALVCPTGHRLASAGEVSPDDLAEETFADVPRSWGIRIATDQAFTQAGVRRHVAYEVADIGSVLDFVHHGLALAILPPLPLPASAAVRTVPLTEPAPCYFLGLATAARRSPTRAAQAFIQTAMLLTDDSVSPTPPLI